MTAEPTEAEETDSDLGKGAVDVLLVDDNETWARTTARLLERQVNRFTVTTAGGLQEARTAYAERTPDCVVCDYQLQRGDGLELLSEVRTDAPSQPFVLVTGEGDEALASEAIGRGVTDYIRKASIGDRATRLAGRIDQTVRNYRTEQALERERRSKDAMLDILRATTSRAGLTREFCHHLVDDRGYACAWIGTYDPSSGVVPRAVAGDGQYVERTITSGPLPDAPREPALVALDEGRSVVATVNRTDSDGGVRGSPAADDSDESVSSGTWRRVATDCRFRSVTAVPIQHDGTSIGVLGVYRSDRDGFDEEERALLVDYGATIGHALRTADWKESLLSATPVAVTFGIRDSSVPLVALAEALPTHARISVQTTVVPDDDRLLYVAEVAGLSADDFRECVATVPSIQAVSVTAGEQSLSCEMTASAPTPETHLINAGARFDATIVDRGSVRVRVNSHAHKAIQKLRNALDAAYADFSVISIQPDENPSRASVTETLTGKQAESLRLAYHSGYFERPRDKNATELADKLGVSRATFTQHVRAAERKLLDEFLDTE